MSEARGGCAEWDERLIEAAFGGPADPELERHLAGCGRCRGAREEYRRTAGALEVALAGDPPAGQAGPRSIDRRWAAALALAAAAALALLLGTWGGGTDGTEPVLTARAEPGGVVVPLGPDRARIERGRARFEVQGGSAEVETPRGPVRSSGASFSVEVRERQEPEMKANAKRAAWVGVAVTAGVVWWAAADGSGAELELGPGESAARGAPAAREPAGTLESPPAEAELAAGDPAPDPGGRSPVSPEPGATEPEAGGAGTPLPLLTGRVLDAATRQPLEGAEVVCGAVAQEGESDWPTASARTGADGRFEVVTRSTSDQLLFRLEGYADRRPHFWEYREEREEAQRAGSADLGEILLHRGARVSGRVLRGADDGPVEGARLLLSAERAGGSIFPTVFARAVGRTGPDGRFELEEPVEPHGSWPYLLMAVTHDGLAWTELPVLEGRERIEGLELAMHVGPSLTVVVEGPDGAPVERATVSARPAFEPLGSPVGVAPSETLYGHVTEIRGLLYARTDAAGRALLSRLPAPAEGPVPYDLWVSAPGLVPGGLRVELAPGREARVRLGALNECSLSGRVVDAQGHPVAGAGLWEQQRELTRTDAAGAFRIEGLPSSRVSITLKVVAEGYAHTLRVVPLPGEGDVEDLELVLERALPLAGRVVDELGRPVAEVHLVFKKAGHVPAIGEAPKMRFVPTDAEGRFQVDEATPGEWVLDWVNPIREPERWQPVPRRSVEAGDEAIEIVLEERPPSGARLVVELVERRSGRSLDPTTQLLQAIVDAKDDPRPRAPFPAATAGRVTVDPIPVGRWRLWIGAPGMATTYVDVAVEGGEGEIRRRLELGPPGAVEGRVQVPEGVRPEALKVETGLDAIVSSWPGGGISGGGGETFVTAPVRPDGSFRLEGLTPGTLRLAVRGAGLERSTTVAVLPGETTWVDL